MEGGQGRGWGSLRAQARSSLPPAPHRSSLNAPAGIQGLPWCRMVDGKGERGVRPTWGGQLGITGLCAPVLEAQRGGQSFPPQVTGHAAAPGRGTHASWLPVQLCPDCHKSIRNNRFPQIMWIPNKYMLDSEWVNGRMKSGHNDKTGPSLKGSLVLCCSALDRPELEDDVEDLET